MTRVQSLSNPETVRALARPIRIRMLDALREADSAAGVARTLGQPRQNVNYHLKELARVGLVEHAGERRNGNFVEQLYRSVAQRFVISPSMAWDRELLASTIRDQASLSRLADLGERLQIDATHLLDRAAFEGETIPSATLEVEIAFDDEADRATFMREYFEALQPLIRKYSRKRGDAFRLALAVYPDTTDREETP